MREHASIHRWRRTMMTCESMMKLSFYVRFIAFMLHVDVKHDSPPSMPSFSLCTLFSLRLINIFNLLLYFLWIAICWFIVWKCIYKYVFFSRHSHICTQHRNAITKLFACCYYLLRKISNLSSNTLFFSFVSFTR